MAEKTQNANPKSTHSSPPEESQLSSQRDPSANPPFRVVSHPGLSGPYYSVEGGEYSWLTQRTFFNKWQAEAAIEVFNSEDTDEAFFLKLSRDLTRDWSTSKGRRVLDAASRNPLGFAKVIRKRIRQKMEADKVRRAKAECKKLQVAKEVKEAAQKLQCLRAAIRKEPKNAELRFNLAIELLLPVRSFRNIADRGSAFWLRIQAVKHTSGSRSESEFKKALNELNVSLALGFNDTRMSAKARFLVIVLSLEADDLQLLSRKTHKHDSVLKSQQEPIKKRLLPLRALADNIVLDTARHLRRDPHDVEAISIQKAAYEFLGDEKGAGQSEQALREARSMHAAGLRTPTSERERGVFKGTRRKNDGLELEATSKQVLEKLGMEARTTQVTGDGGIDIEAYDTRPITAGKYIIQCKDWEHPVGVTEVRELYGVMMDAGAIKGILISTGTFTKQAYEFAKGKPLELIDGEALRGLISSLDNK